MEALTIRSSWSQLPSMFKGRKREIESPAGEKSHKYEPLRMTPELEARIAEAEKNVREGNCVTLRSPEEIDRYFDSL